jgi:glycosyltransferase involved in cell wall biosynthesis
MNSAAIQHPNLLVTDGTAASKGRKLHIGLLIHSLLPGGAERVCSLLASHWAEQGHRVTLMTFTPTSTDSYAVSPAVQRVEIGHWQLSPNRWHSFRKNLARVWRVRQVIQGRHAGRNGGHPGAPLDVALSFMSVSNSCVAVAGLGTGVARIGSERTYPPKMALGRVGEITRWWMYGWLDAVVAQTEDAARWLRQHTRTRVAAAVANPVCLPLMAKEPRLNPAHFVRPGAKLLLAVGRLSEEKNFEALIRAFAEVISGPRSADNVSWQLALIGTGPLRDPLQTLIAQLGVQDHVLMPGHAGNVGDWYAAADAFALTSHFEGYPNALLEALACGVPAVACDVMTGPRELIEHGVNGLLVEPNSHPALTQGLARIMNDGALRERLAAQAATTVDKHAIARIASRWETIFRTALVSRGKSS